MCFENKVFFPAAGCYALHRSIWWRSIITLFKPSISLLLDGLFFFSFFVPLLAASYLKGKGFGLFPQCLFFLNKTKTFIPLKLWPSLSHLTFFFFNILHFCCFSVVFQLLCFSSPHRLGIMFIILKSYLGLLASLLIIPTYISDLSPGTVLLLSKIIFQNLLWWQSLCHKFCQIWFVCKCLCWTLIRKS